MSIFNRLNYKMVVRNISTAVNDGDLQRIVPAIGIQVFRDFYPAWGLRCVISFLDAKAPVPAGVMRIDVKDVSDDPGALGYHMSEDGLPVTYVFAKDDMADGAGLDGLSATLSHEVLEMLADPEANLYAIGPDPSDGSDALFPFETCDSVQGNSYKINGVAVSDFVFPEWFEPARKTGERFNQMNTLRAPFVLDAGGYASIRLQDGSWVDRWGAKRTALPAARHRLAARQHGIV